MNIAYSREAMHALLGLDAADRQAAIGAVEALAADPNVASARAWRRVPADDDATADDATADNAAGDADSSPQKTEDGDPPGASATDPSEDDAADDDAKSVIERRVITVPKRLGLMPLSEGCGLHALPYSRHGDLVVSVEEETVIVLALINVVGGLKQATEQ